MWISLIYKLNVKRDPIFNSATVLPMRAAGPSKHAATWFSVFMMLLAGIGRSDNVGKGSPPNPYLDDLAEADRYERQDRAEDAVSVYDQLLPRIDADPTRGFLAAAVRVQRARDLLRATQYDSAIKATEEVEQLYGTKPDVQYRIASSNALYVRASTYYELIQMGPALETCKQVQATYGKEHIIAIRRNVALAMRMEGGIDQYHKRYVDAASVFRRMIKKFKGSKDKLIQKIVVDCRENLDIVAPAAKRAAAQGE